MKGQFYIFFVFVLGTLIVLNIFLFAKQRTTNLNQILGDDTVFLGKDFELGFKYYRSYGVQGSEYLDYINIFNRTLKKRNYNFDYNLTYKKKNKVCINYTVFNKFYSYSNSVCA